MKFGVVVFPGSNCDHDMIYALEKKIGADVDVLWHKSNSIGNVDCVVLPGGFSYGDYLRSGAIARFSPIMNAVIAHCKKGGYAMGVCNGFQILCEAGLLPGALLANNNRRFICKNVFIKAGTANTAITSAIDPEQPLKIPIAHGEGRYYADGDTLKGLQDRDEIIFRYCDAGGIVSEDSNPNGSVDNIAGVTNRGRNVFGMMPHPERAADEALGNTDGALIFNSLIHSGKLPA